MPRVRGLHVLELLDEALRLHRLRLEHQVRHRRHVRRHVLREFYAFGAEAPRVGRGRRAYVPLKGELPSPLAPPPGCRFHTRCPHVMPICKTDEPKLKTIAPRRVAACHLNDNTDQEDRR